MVGFLALVAQPEPQRRDPLDAQVLPTPQSAPLLLLVVVLLLLPAVGEARTLHQVLELLLQKTAAVP